MRSLSVTTPLLNDSSSSFQVRGFYCANYAYAVSRCLPVRPSVHSSRSGMVSKRLNILSKFYTTCGSIISNCVPKFRRTDRRPTNGRTGDKRTEIANLNIARCIHEWMQTRDDKDSPAIADNPRLVYLRTFSSRPIQLRHVKRRYYVLWTRCPLSVTICTQLTKERTAWR